MSNQGFDFFDIVDSASASASDSSPADYNYPAAPAANDDSDNTAIAPASSPVIPFWPDAVAALPTELTRTALFGLARSRKQVVNAQIGSRSDISIIYTGESLDQGDADVWLACLSICKSNAFDALIPITLRQLARMTGKSNDGRTIARIKKTLARLSGASITLSFTRKSKKIKVATHLLSFVAIDDAYSVKIPVEAASLFANLTFIDNDKRNKVKRSTSKALMMYAAGHKAGSKHCIRLDLLAGWLGYTSPCRKFATAISEAGADLLDVNFFDNFEIDKDKKTVKWTRTANA